MPPSTNRVALDADALDQHGLPVPDVDVAPDDVAVREDARERTAELHRAVGPPG